MDYISSVAEFHHTFGHPILSEAQIPDEKRANLRISLLQEELDELKEAVKENDIVAVADALSDLQYVLSGAILEFGLKDKFNTLFAEVHRSNMSKACVSEAEAQETIKFYKENKGEDAYFKEIDGKFLVYRKSDHKTLKSINYSEAELGKIVNA